MRSMSFSRTLRSFRKKTKNNCDINCTAHSSADETVMTTFSNEQQIIIDNTKNQQWKLLLINLNSKDLVELDENLCATDEFDDASLLHFVLHHNPPFSIVSKIVHDIPSSLFRKDRLDRTPLHVAIESGASKYVAGHLAAKNPNACNLVDHQGKTPLHRCFDGDLDSLPYEVIVALVDASPSSLDIEDISGMCAVELAILSEAPMKVIMMLQRAKRCHLRIQNESLPKSRSWDGNHRAILPLDDSRRKNSITSQSA